MIYARVSSKEQEKEGFSIPAQLKLLKEYAAAQGFTVAQEYVDVETAKQTGRAAFGEMVAYLKAHPSVRVMLVEKTDRLYRNLKDWVTIDELDVEIHFPKEGVVLSREVPLLGKVHARHQGADGEELHRQPVRGSPQGHAGEGRAGHLADQDRRSAIATSLARTARRSSPPIRRSRRSSSKLFEWYATRRHFAEGGGAEGARERASSIRRSGAKVPVSTVHTILRNRLYTGWFEWNGKLIQGRHEPLVSVELWERVQGVLDGRFAKKAKRGKHDFAFSGLIACAMCGCAVVGEIKKQRYVYYHCTGYADKCQGNPASCRRKYVREEALEAAVHRTARPTEVRRRGAGMGARGAARQPCRRAPRARGSDPAPSGRIQAPQRPDQRHVRRQARRAGRRGLLRPDVGRMARGAEPLPARDRTAPRPPTSYMDEGVQILELARNAQRLFAQQEPREKRRLLNFVLSNCTWEDGEVVATFRQPFDFWRKRRYRDAPRRRERAPKSAKTEIWLGN